MYQNGLLPWANWIPPSEITPRTPLGECSERRPVETEVNVKNVKSHPSSIKKGRKIETTLYSHEKDYLFKFAV